MARRYRCPKLVVGLAVRRSQLDRPRRRDPPTGRPGEHVCRACVFSARVVAVRSDDDRTSVPAQRYRAAKTVAGRAVGCSQLDHPGRRCPPAGRPGEHIDGARSAPVARGSDDDRASVVTHGYRASKAVKRLSIERCQLGGLCPAVHALGKHVGGPGLLPGVAIA